MEGGMVATSVRDPGVQNLFEKDRDFRKDPRIHWLPYDAADLVDQAAALVANPDL